LDNVERHRLSLGHEAQKLEAATAFISVLQEKCVHVERMKHLLGAALVAACAEPSATAVATAEMDGEGGSRTLDAFNDWFTLGIGILKGLEELRLQESRFRDRDPVLQADLRSHYPGDGLLCVYLTARSALLHDPCAGYKPFYCGWKPTGKAHPAMLPVGKHVNADLTRHLQGLDDGLVLDLPQLFRAYLGPRIRRLGIEPLWWAHELPT
jgi:hypothetical protein